MKYFASTPNSLVLIQFVSFIISVLGLLLVDFTFYYFLISIICFYMYSVFGISMTLHRYYSHKSFSMNPVLKWIFTVFAVLAGRGSPVGWVYTHRIHHCFSDTEKDPHSPNFDTFKFIGFKPLNDKKINHFIIRDMMTPIQLKIDKYYLLIILMFLFLLAIINIKLVLFVWAIPVFFVSITQTLFNFFAHKFGYRNFETADKSTNNVYLWPFILGDAWHNNHHHNAGKLSTKIKKFEFDPIVIFINLIKKNV